MDQETETERGRTPLTRQRILDAALAFVDRHGVEALSMRKLGAELGVEAMALYYHLPSKAALLDGLVERVVAGLNPPGGRELDWPERLRALLAGFRQRLLAHPNVLPLLLARPVQTAEVLRTVEAEYAALHAAGLDAQAVLDAVRTLGAYVIGYLMTEAQFAEAGHAAAAERQWRPDAAPLPPDEFPLTLELAPYQGTRDWDEQFDAGLDLIFDGIRARRAKQAKR